MLEYFVFWKCQIVKDEISQFKEVKVSEIYFAIEILGKYFQLYKQTFYFIRPQNTWILIVFAIASLGQIKDQGLTTKHFQKYILQWIFFVVAKLKVTV